jgi:hypothetical protein
MVTTYVQSMCGGNCLCPHLLADWSADDYPNNGATSVAMPSSLDGKSRRRALKNSCDYVTYRVKY